MNTYRLDELERALDNGRNLTQSEARELIAALREDDRDEDGYTPSYTSPRRQQPSRANSDDAFITGAIVGGLLF